MILAVVFGPMMEKAFRQSLIAYKGDFTIFFGRPISAVLLGLAILLLVLPMMPKIFRRDKIAKLENVD